MVRSRRRRYADTMEPEQFFYSMLTRSQRISHETLRLRDPKWLEGYEGSFSRQALRYRTANARFPAAHALSRAEAFRSPIGSSCPRWRCIRRKTG